MRTVGWSLLCIGLLILGLCALKPALDARCQAQKWQGVLLTDHGLFCWRVGEKQVELGPVDISPFFEFECDPPLYPVPEPGHLL